MKQKKVWIALGVVLLLLLIDQWSKIYVKTHFVMHESYYITDWFQLVFIENRGMAFGLEVAPKPLLTLFRLIASGAGVWYIYHVIRQGRMGVGYVITLSAILAGAIGNIIDSLFYGLIFNDPVGVPAQFVAFGEGYGSFLSGRVVDMFYFPLVTWEYPTWVPIWGGEQCTFFSPIFNFADACISCGFAAFILFYRHVLVQPEENTSSPEAHSPEDNPHS